MYLYNDSSIFSSYTDKILATYNAAFSPASTPIVAVGTPRGISTIDKRESKPSFPVLHGTPITGFVDVCIVDKPETTMYKSI